MAAFSYQHHPFLPDSIFLPNTPNYKMSSSVEEDHINRNCFYQFNPLELPQQIAVDEKVRESSCLDHCSKVAVSDSEPSLTKKQSAESSTVVDKLDSGEQVTQKVKPTEKKRKSRNGASLTYAQSKEPTEGKIKKLIKKCYGSMKEEGEKKPKPEKKVPEEPPTGYIRVRARRGQATDSHSLAERVRREKISERMRMLQRLVPGCDRVTGKALMLEEIINYVQSLQNQVEFLSMKLASVNPMFYDFGMELDGVMVREESLNSMASPLTSVTQYCNPTQPAGFPDINTTAAFATASNCPYVHNSAPLLLQHEERPNSFSLDIASIFCDAEDQRQYLLNQSGFSNNLCFFH